MSKEIFRRFAYMILCIIYIQNIHADTISDNLLHNLDFNKTNINDFLNDKEDLNEIIIYGTKECIFCVYSIKLAQYHDIQFQFFELDNVLYNQLTVKTLQKTIPYIFINKKFIGGYQNLLFILNRK